MEGDPQVLAVQPARMRALGNSAASEERAPAAGLDWSRWPARMHALLDSAASARAPAAGMDWPGGPACMHGLEGISCTENELLQPTAGGDCVKGRAREEDLLALQVHAGADHVPGGVRRPVIMPLPMVVELLAVVAVVAIAVGLPPAARAPGLCPAARPPDKRAKHASGPAWSASRQNPGQLKCVGLTQAACAARSICRRTPRLCAPSRRRRPRAPRSSTQSAGAAPAGCPGWPRPRCWGCCCPRTSP